MKTINAIKKFLGDNIQANFNIKLKNIDLISPPEDKLGDYGLACFELAKKLSKSPQEVAKELATNFELNELITEVKNVGPYLNLFVSPVFIRESLGEIIKDKKFGSSNIAKQQKVLIEFSGPNTNKPQHIGHLRNNCLGQALTNIFRQVGYQVIPVNIINDRGIHIAKSMLAYQEFGNGATPQSSGLKGDHLVGKYYVKFGQELAKEQTVYAKQHKIDFSKLNNLDRREAEDKFFAQSKWMAKARTMLKAWEAGDKTIKALWKQMNDWVYDGYKVTYDRLGIKFDKNYYESQTYLLGKDIIQTGLKKQVFFTKNDGSIWIDLSKDKLGEKVVMRADGTSVYLTQDLGTAAARYKEFKFDKHIYVVASEQDYHFKVLFATLKKLGLKYSDKLYHLSYGMVSRPEGKIKSREGKTADADNIMDEARDKAAQLMAAAIKQVKTTAQQEKAIAEIVGLGAVKFFMLGTNPQKNIVYNPQESISFDGYTGTFVQYTHARINNMLAKAGKITVLAKTDVQFNEEENKLIKLLIKFPAINRAAASEYNPAILAQYLFNVAKTFNNFYQHHSVLQAENNKLKQSRLNLSAQTKKVLQDGLNLLGIEAPDKM